MPPQRPNGLLAPPPQAPAGYTYVPSPDGWTIQSDRPGLHINPNKLAEALLSLAPGSGEVMDAQGSLEAGQEGWDNLKAGNVGAAASNYAASVASGLGAVPVVGLGVRGVRKATKALADLLADTARVKRTIDHTATAADRVALPGTLAGLGDDG